MEGYSKRVNIKIQAQVPSEIERINELLHQYQKNQGFNPNVLTEAKHQKCKSNYLLKACLKKWLCQKGKQYLVDLNNHQRMKLKTFFNTFDKKKRGYIGLDQLEQILLGLGLAEGMEDVKKMVGNLDQGHSGKINFQQFIQMIRDDNKQNLAIVNFFKHLTLAKTPKQKQFRITAKHNFTFSKFTSQPTKSQKQIFQQNLPFEIKISQIRRNHILSSMNIGRFKQAGKLNDNRVSKGKQVVKAIQKMDERRLMRKLRENSHQGLQQICVAQK